MYITSANNKKNKTWVIKAILKYVSLSMAPELLMRFHAIPLLQLVFCYKLYNVTSEYFI